MNKKILILGVLFAVVSVFLIQRVRNFKTSAFLKARNKTCNELEDKVNERLKNKSSEGNFTVKKCDCYFAPDQPNKEIERKSKNYCYCDCQTSEGNITLNIRKSIG